MITVSPYVKQARTTLPNGVSELLRADFDAVQYVTTLRRSMALSDIASAVEQELGVVDNQITLILSEQRHTVAELHAKQREIISRMEPLEVQASRMASEVSDLLTAARAVFAAVAPVEAEALQLQCEISAKKGQLKLMSRLASILEHAEAVSGPASLRVPLFAIWAQDLVAAEARVGRMAAAATPASPHVARLAARVREALARRLREQLAAWATSAAAPPAGAAGPGPSAAVDYAVAAGAALANLGDEEGVAEILRATLAAPLVEQAWAAAEASDRSTAERFRENLLKQQVAQNDCQTVIRFFDSLRAQLEAAAAVRALLARLEASVSGVTAQTFVEDRLAAVFTPAFPEHFAKLYLSWRAALTAAFAPEAAERFLGSREWRAWSERWRTQMYETSRWRRISEAARERLRADGPEAGDPLGSAHLVKLLVQAVEGGATLEIDTALENMAELVLLECGPTWIESAEKSGRNAAPVAYCRCIEALMRVWNFFSSDQYWSSFSAATSNSQDTNVAVCRVRTTIADELVALASKVGKKFETRVREFAAAECLAIQGIPPLFRMTARPTPTKTSAYVKHIQNYLRKTEEAVQKSSERLMPTECTLLKSLAQTAIDIILDEVATRTSAVLAALQQQERSMYRFSSANATQSRDSKEPSDAFKICVQLELDIRSLAADDRLSENSDTCALKKAMKAVETARTTYAPKGGDQH